MRRREGFLLSLLYFSVIQTLNVQSVLTGMELGHLGLRILP